MAEALHYEFFFNPKAESRTLRAKELAQFLQGIADMPGDGGLVDLEEGGDSLLAQAPEVVELEAVSFAIVA